VEKSRGKLSRKGLLQICFESFTKKFPENGRKRPSTHPGVIDCLMSCVAVFQLKYPSLLQFDKEHKEDPILKGNLKRLYNVENPPSDTTMREKLDVIEPSDIRGIFKTIFAAAQRGKVLEQYQYLDKHYLLSIDGTAQFSSSKIHCDNCCITNHTNGNKTYHHKALAGAIVHPEMKKVIPIAPEAMTMQDGDTKNDCEQNAVKRLLADFRREHPHLKTIVTEDSLYANGPHIDQLIDLNIRFVIVAKEGNLVKLFEWIRLLDNDAYNIHNSISDGGKYNEFKWYNNAPLNDANYETKVNFLEYWETDKKGNKKYFAWISDIVLNKDNVEEVMRIGRVRWKIENETFNTLKNQGYNFEHNYGHGEQNLCSIMGMLMMLAFLMDQLSFLCDSMFQKAKDAMGPCYALWENIRVFFRVFEFSNWDDLFNLIAKKRKLSSA
jgi:Transposase DDE domain